MIRGSLCPILLLLLSQPAAAENPRVKPWYLGVKGGALLVDGKRGADHGHIYGVELGANLTTKWSLEAELFIDRVSFDAGFDLDHSGFAVNLIQFNRAPLWNPYFLLGMGALRFDAPGESDSNVMAQVAVGGMWTLTDNGWLLRAEARYRYSPADSPTPGLLKDAEPVLTIGLTIPFGR